MWNNLFTCTVATPYLAVQNYRLKQRVRQKYKMVNRVEKLILKWNKVQLSGAAGTFQLKVHFLHENGYKIGSSLT